MQNRVQIDAANFLDRLRPMLAGKTWDKRNHTSSDRASLRRGRRRPGFSWHRSALEQWKNRRPIHSLARNSKAEKKNQWAAASANFARRTPRHPRTLRSTTAAAMPAFSKMDLQRAAA